MADIITHQEDTRAVAAPGPAQGRKHATTPRTLYRLLGLVAALAITLTAFISGTGAAKATTDGSSAGQVTGGYSAFAAEPGESGSWNEEYVGTQELAARGTMREARNTQGDLLQVWRGETNNIVWLSYDNEQPFQLTNPDGSSTATNVSPAVVPIGSNNFMVIHTGTDGNIYYAMVTPNGTSTPGWSGQWTAIPYQSTNDAVSVTQFGPGSNDLYMVYRSSIDDRVWGTRYNSADNAWDNVENIGGGESPAAPSVAWNNQSGTLNVVSRGEDNQVWMTSGYSYDWNSWSPQGGYTYVSPSIAVNDQTGTMLVGYVNENSYVPNYRQYTSNAIPLEDWSQDVTWWQTVNPFSLSNVNGAIYAVLTGLNGYVYYKQVYYKG